MHFLDLRKTSASSRRPVFANPRLRRDLNLCKIDQSTSDIPLFAGEEFVVREKPIREKFIIWWKYIYPEIR